MEMIDTIKTVTVGQMITRFYLFYAEAHCIKHAVKIPGVNQSQKEETGKLGTLGTVGNLWRIRINPDKETGTWKINIKSTQPYTLKVTGQT